MPLVADYDSRTISNADQNGTRKRRTSWQGSTKGIRCPLLWLCKASADTFRFKKDMWEKIAKEMALPWRAAEAMHWQIGEVEMASRANVPVFHLAGQQPSHPMQYTASSTSNSANEARSLSASPDNILAPFSASTHSRDNDVQPGSSARDSHRRGSDASMGGADRPHNTPYQNPAQRSAAPTSDLDVPASQRAYLSPFRSPG